jgi:hypothetical protein
VTSHYVKVRNNAASNLLCILFSVCSGGEGAAPAECSGGPEPSAQVRAGADTPPARHHLLVQGRDPAHQLAHSDHHHQEVGLSRYSVV